MIKRWGKVLCMVVIGCGILYYGCRKKEKEEKVRKVYEVVKGNFTLEEYEYVRWWAMAVKEKDTLTVSVRSVDPDDGLIGVEVGDTLTNAIWKEAHEVTMVSWVIEVPKSTDAGVVVLHEDIKYEEEPITVYVEIKVIRWEKQPTILDVGW